MASLRVICQALPSPSSTPRSATNMPAFMLPANANHAPSRGVAALASGSPFTSAQRESNASFWRPDCPPDEDDVRSVPFSVWPRKAAKKVERPSAAWQPGSGKAFRNTIEEVNYMNTRIQFKSDDDEEQVAKRFNPLRLLGL